MRGRRAVTLVLVAAVAAAVPGSVPAVLAQGDSTPTPRPSLMPEPTPIPVVSASGRPDLYLDMPYNLGGFEPEVVMARGEEHFAGLDPHDPTRQGLEGLLETLGADIDDMVSGYALVAQPDFFSFVVAIRIDGIDPGSLLPAYLPILYEDLEDPQSSFGRAAGKDVLIIDSIGEDDERVALYVYDEGDTIWMLQGPDDVVEIALSQLPHPLTRDG